MSAASVLVVDDETGVRELFARWLVSGGYDVRMAANADEAINRVQQQAPAVALCDIRMPGHDGLWLANEVQRAHPHTAVVIATAYTELLDGEAQQQPVADLLIKPFQRERFALAVDRGRQWRKQTLEEVHWHAVLSIELRDRAAAICDQLHARVAAGEDESDALLALAAERMPDTAEHGERVARYAHSVAREMGVLLDVGPALTAGARFHDIGKIAIPEALLTKPSPLTAGEIAIMRQHVEVGAEILHVTGTLADAAPIVAASHEWFNGTGYPWKLAGEEIPLASRIVAVVDAYDAMTQHRAYRVRLDSSDAIAELLRCCPAQFDPEVVAAFLAVLGRH